MHRMLAVTAIALSTLSHIEIDASASEPVKESGWIVSNLLWPCAGDCAITVLAGQSISQTPMTSIFLHFESPANWKWDYTFLVAAAASRPLVQYKDYFSIEPEIGVARRFGDAEGFEGWAALFLRWKAFPWNEYVRTSVAIGVGPSISGNIIIEPGYLRNVSGTGIANYFSPELTLGLPNQPRFDLVVRFHHRSQIWGVIPQTTDATQFWTAGFRACF